MKIYYPELPPGYFYRKPGEPVPGSEYYVIDNDIDIYSEELNSKGIPKLLLWIRQRSMPVVLKELDIPDGEITGELEFDTAQDALDMAVARLKMGLTGVPNE